MKIKKYINDAQSSGVASKLLSYSAMAAAFVATGPEAIAQCAGEIAAPGAPVGLDIDGDGTDDVQIFGGSYFTQIGSGTSMVAAGTIPVGTFPIAYAYAMASIPQTSFAGQPYYGCSLFSFGYGPFAGPATLVVGPVVTTATAAASAMVSYTNVFTNFYYNTYLSVNYCFVTALGSNQIVGLSATGTGVCGVIDSAPGVAGVGTSSLVGSNYVAVSAYAVQVVGGIRYDFPTSTITAMATALTTISGITCSTSSAPTFGGYYVAGPQIILSTMATAAVPPQTDLTYPGPYVLAGPSYGSNVLATGGTNPVTAVAVQFLGPDLDGDGNPDTYNGWVTLSCNGDGTVTCTGSGYQQCSIENAIAEANSTAADACINVGEATNESPNCSTDPLVCMLADAGLVVGACDTGADPNDTVDDTFTFTLNPTGTDLGATYDVSGDVTMAGVSYGSAVTFDNGGAGYPAGTDLNITITDGTDATCTLAVTVTAPATCSTPLVCEISATTSNIMCDPGVTPEDGEDDTVTFDITVLDTGGGGTTWSDNMGNTGQSYGTAVSYGPFLAGGSQSIVITDDGDPDCMQTITVSLNDCATVENIPTVGEWGLIILGLMMSITAIVGIRQRREEEVTV